MNKDLEKLGKTNLRDFFPPLHNILIHAALVAVACFIGLHLVTKEGHVAALWLADGITLGVLLTCPRRLWTVCLLTGLTVNIAMGWIYGTNYLLTVFISLANVVEIVVAAVVIYRPDRPAHHFTDRDSAVRIGLGFILAPAVSMLIAGTARQILIGASFEQTIQVWYLAHAIGFAVVTPMTLTVLFNDFAPMLRSKQLPRTTTVLLVLAIITTFVFRQTTLPLLFLIFPPLALIVFQLGFPGMTIGLFIVGVEVSYLTIAGSGPFMLMRDATSGQRILMEQIFLLTCVSMALPIAIALTERKRLERRLLSAQEQLRQLAATDQLTGISNRRMFDEFLDREWKRAMREKKPLCAIMIDVDCFKSYNDRYGHQAGDECLKAVALGLAEVVRRPGDLVARYGGEEFVVLLPHTALDGGRFVGEQIRRKIESLQLVHAGTTDGRVTVSLGVEMAVPHEDGTAGDLIAGADALLYCAKHNGRNCVMATGDPAAVKKLATA